MEIRVNDIQNTAPVEQKPQVQDTDSNFKFALVSNIEEKNLQALLSSLMNEISEQGKKISKHTDVRDMRRYRELIRNFLNEIVNRSHHFSRENFLDRKGRHRVYGIIKLIDKNLDELASQLINDEVDNIEVLNRIDEIRGLLLDILT